MTWQWTRTAGAAALLLAVGGCFSEVSPTGMSDDDDGGTTTEAPATDDTSGDPSVSPTSSSMSSASSGEVFDTTGAPETTGLGDDSSGSGATTGPPPPPTRVDLYPRACDTDTMWESHLGGTSCIDGDANGEIITHLDKGRFKRVISARPPTTDGPVMIRGRFPDLSLVDLATPVLRGQAACSAKEKCEATLVIRILDPYSDAEEIHTETLVGDEPVNFVIPLEAFEVDVVEVVLQANSMVSAVSGEAATAVLWSDMHIAG